MKQSLRTSVNLHNAIIVLTQKCDVVEPTNTLADVLEFQAQQKKSNRGLS